VDLYDIEHITTRVLEKLEERLRNRSVVEKKSEDDPIIFSMEKKVQVDNPKNAKLIEAAQAITPARIGIGRAGTRMKTNSLLRFRIDHAAAQDAVLRGVSEEFINRLGLPILHTKADSLEKYLMDLDAGRKLDDESVEWIRKNCPTRKQVQIIVSDGLSSSAVEANIPDLLPALIQGLEMNNISYGMPIFIKRSRVWVQDQVAQLVDCDVVISLIGERPGLATAESLSAYMVYRPTEQTVEADRTVISNIHRGGTPPIEAGAYLAELLKEILALQASGVKFATSRG
jgi:ethanolamine ammonia-lyase small subunit